MAPRPESLEGLAVGIIWNNRAFGKAIFDRVSKVLASKYHVRDVVFRRKTFIGNAAQKEILDEIAEKCDVVITGVGD
ncbi:MAG: hypothetical protein HYX92_22245 [Chloroflexi bacterium]|nr:hypothetical protein [Chloroflexota bacterium]